MTEELPTPRSRKEEYLAKAAGMGDIELPEPASREEQYLNAIAEGGGGGGGTSDFNELSNRPKYNGAAMTGETDIPLSPSIVQTTGTSQTDVMSQDATTSMVFRDPSTKRIIQIGDGASAQNYNDGVAIGRNSKANGTESVCIGKGAGYNTSASNYFVALGSSSGSGMSGVSGSVSLGAYSKATRTGEVNVGSTSTSYGFNSSAYRVIGGVYDGQDLHDAATVAQGNTLANSAPTTSTVGVLGQLYTDTTDMHTYQCTAISGSTYTWTQRW